jgi:hypothetical protein
MHLLCTWNSVVANSLFRNTAVIIYQKYTTNTTNILFPETYTSGAITGLPILHPSHFPQWHKLVSTPEAVVGAHAKSQVEAVILHTLFTTFTFYFHFFFGACRLTQTPT